MTEAPTTTKPIGFVRSGALRRVAHGYAARYCPRCDRFGSTTICYLCQTPMLARDKARELCACPICTPVFEPTRESLIRAALDDLERRLGFTCYEYDVE